MSHESSGGLPMHQYRDNPAGVTASTADLQDYYADLPVSYFCSSPLDALTLPRLFSLPPPPPIFLRQTVSTTLLRPRIVCQAQTIPTLPVVTFTWLLLIQLPAEITSQQQT